ncbi:MAG: leucyl aminopeptidase [Bacteroidota bacterium]
MKLSVQVTPPERAHVDVLAVFLHSDDSVLRKDIKALGSAFGSSLFSPTVSGDFKGKEKESALIYSETSGGPKRILLIGLGEKKKATHETFRRAAARAAKRCFELKVRTMGFMIPLMPKDVFRTVLAAGEGASLGLYRFDKYISKPAEDRHAIGELVLLTSDRRSAAEGEKALAQASIVAQAAMFARDLSNAPGNEIYPETLAKAAIESGKKSGYKVRVMEKAEIEKLGMGGIIGVSQGSSRPPRFIVMEHNKSAKKTVVLVGKGVTFDTGGISIKPSAGMAEMKMDMAGAAAVIGTMEAVARLKLRVHVVGLVPAVENMPGGNSVRPGDILRHYNGKTSEVDNTDAEGRLILADALGYAEKFKPAAVIDLATLTGACVVALGHHATGMMGNNDALMVKLKTAGEATYERVWQLPLYDEYEKQIKSDVADVKNVGGRWAGAITAGWFLKKFIGDYPWVHLDIAGTAMMEENGDYTQRGGSGVGVRLLVEFLKAWK